MKDNSVKTTAVKVLLWVLSFGWMWVIFGFSSQNGTQSSGLSEKVSAFFVKLFTGQNFMDLEQKSRQEIEFVVRKLAHFSEYAILGMLFVLLVIVYQKKKHWYATAAVAALCYAAVDELHQGFTPGRVPAVRDVMIDFCGALTGIVFIIIVKGFVKKRKFHLFLK